MKFLETFVHKNFKLKEMVGYISENAIELLAPPDSDLNLSKNDYAFVCVKTLPLNFRNDTGLSEDLSYHPKLIISSSRSGRDKHLERYLKNEFRRELSFQIKRNDRYVKNFESYRLDEQTARQKAITLVVMQVTLQFLKDYKDISMLYEVLKDFQPTGEIALHTPQEFCAYVSRIQRKGLFEGILLSKQI